MGFLDRFRRDSAPAKFTPAEGDQLVVRAIRDQGEDLSKPREVNQYLYFPSRESADAAAETIRAMDYTVTVEPAANADENPPNPWLVFATQIMVVDEHVVVDMRPRFEAIAGSNGGEYDGWEAGPAA